MKPLLVELLFNCNQVYYKGLNNNLVSLLFRYSSPPSESSTRVSRDGRPAKGRGDGMPAKRTGDGMPAKGRPAKGTGDGRPAKGALLVQISNKQRKLFVKSKYTLGMSREIT